MIGTASTNRLPVTKIWGADPPELNLAAVMDSGSSSASILPTATSRRVAIPAVRLSHYMARMATKPTAETVCASSKVPRRTRRKRPTEGLHQSRPWTEPLFSTKGHKAPFSSAIQPYIPKRKFDGIFHVRVWSLPPQLDSFLNKPNRFSRPELCIDCSKVNLRHMLQSHRSWPGFGWRNAFRPLQVPSLE